MSFYETVKSALAIIGLLVTSGIVGHFGWHALVAIRRLWANRAVRESERAKARVQPARPTSELDIGYESTGVIPVQNRDR